MAAPIRERLPLPVGDGRDVLGREGAEQDEDQVTAAGAMLSAELRQAECGLISGAAAMPAGSADLRPAWPEAPVPPAADALYDARRGVYYTKPVLRGWLHLVWFEISVVIGTLLLARAHGATRITAAAIYAASVSALFGVSALYHRGNWTAAWRRRLQRLDHAMIFFLIAGTATPAFLLANRGPFGLVCLIVMWTLTLTAAAVHMAWMSAPEVVVGGTFVGLGWVAALALPGVWIHAGAVPAMLVLAGGLLYTAGALSYHRRRPDPYPSVFGYHEIFHAYVCAAATCQFAAIALFII
jgi:hemolysin III